VSGAIGGSDIGQQAGSYQDSAAPQAHFRGGNTLRGPVSGMQQFQAGATAGRRSAFPAPSWQ
jgi:hypothetical protein